MPEAKEESTTTLSNPHKVAHSVNNILFIVTFILIPIIFSTSSSQPKFIISAFVKSALHLCPTPRRKMKSPPEKGGKFINRLFSGKRGEDYISSSAPPPPRLSRKSGNEVTTPCCRHCRVQRVTPDHFGAHVNRTMD